MRWFDDQYEYITEQSNLLNSSICSWRLHELDVDYGPARSGLPMQDVVIGPWQSDR